MKKTKFISEKRILFAFPHLALSIIFVIVPILILLANAFMDKNTGEFTFNNFVMFFKVGENNIWTVVGRSFLMAFLTTLVCFVLCYPLALALNNVKGNKTMIFLMLFILPMWVSSLLRIISIQLLLEEIIGLGFTLTLIGMVYEFLPFMLLPLYTSIANTDSSFMEASEDLGASTLQTLFRVRLPLSVPGIISGVLMVFMPTMCTFAVSERLGGKVKLFGQLINQIFEEPNKGLGSAYSLVLMLLIVISVLIATKLSKGKSSPATGGMFS